MDKNAMNALSYGLFVLTVSLNGKDNGCIINTATQVTAEPNRIAIALNKLDHTHDMLMKADSFSISVISEEADFELFKHFGFQSGRDVDKFADFADCRRVAGGQLVVTKGTNAYISAEIQQRIDLDTHTLFIAKVTDAEKLSEAASATYAYYHGNIKPKPQKVGIAPSGKIIWRCTICGYEYEGDELPEDFICPICNHPASDFEKVIV